MHSLLFLFNSLALPSISSKSLKFRSALFSIPTNTSFPHHWFGTSPVRTIKVSTGTKATQKMRKSVEDTGLAIATRIVTKHGDTIHVPDNFAAGLRFLITLPAADVPSPCLADRLTTSLLLDLDLAVLHVIVHA